MPISRRLAVTLIAVAAAISTLPLLVNGCSCGHDFDFHLLSWLEAARQFSHGNLHPHWAVHPAYNAGEPRFVFYPPLSWTIGALLTLLLTHLPVLSPAHGFTFAPILYTWLALTAAGLALYALARRYVAPPTALISATLYLANPYTLFTAYERTAYAELLAAALIPLLLLAILPSPGDQPRISIPRIAVAVALLWLTNAPAAVMGCYTLALLAILHLLSGYRHHRNLRALLAPASSFTAGTTLGLALAAFYILPAAYERRWVEISMATIPGMRIVDNTLFHHTADPEHDAVLHTASIIAVILLALAAGALSIAWSSRRAPSSTSTSSHPQSRSGDLSLLLALSILTAVIALLLTPLAAPLWRHAPELAFLQFPWRFLAILAPVLALSLALALRTLRLRTPVALALSLILPGALTLAAWPAFRQACDPPDTPQAQLSRLPLRNRRRPHRRVHTGNRRQRRPRPHQPRLDTRARAIHRTPPRRPRSRSLGPRRQRPRNPHPQPPRLPRLAAHPQRLPSHRSRRAPGRTPRRPPPTRPLPPRAHLPHHPRPDRRRRHLRRRTLHLCPACCRLFS